MNRTTQPIKVVSVLDPALDVVAMAHDLNVYSRTRDASLLKFKPGVEPTWFWVGRANASMFMTWVHPATSEGERFRRAFQCGVTRIENIEDLDGETHKVMVPTEQQKTPTGVQTYWSDLEISKVPLVFVDEIGSIAFDLSYMGKLNAASFQLPALSRRALGQRLSLDAAAHVNKLRSLKSAQLQEQTTDDSGEKDTAATATA